jgi:hypothetical protein
LGSFLEFYLLFSSGCKGFVCTIFASSPHLAFPQKDFSDARCGANANTSAGSAPLARWSKVAETKTAKFSLSFCMQIPFLVTGGGGNDQRMREDQQEMSTQVGGREMFKIN